MAKLDWYLETKKCTNKNTFVPENSSSRSKAKWIEMSLHIWTTFCKNRIVNTAPSASLGNP